MKKILFIFALLFSFSSGLMAQDNVKRALVIGIGEYEDPAWSKINGDKDIDYVLKMLRAQDFKDIVVLKNKQATKRAIVNAFCDLAFRCDYGDKVYIHYSGHGQLMTDLNGDESVKWNASHSKWDESWIPYDAYMTYCDKDRGEKHLSDDEVAEYLRGIRGNIGDEGELVVAIDACHSGDGTCGIDDVPTRGIGMKFCIPHEEDMFVEQPAKEEWLTISACQPNQLNFEMKEPSVGKLTYALFYLGIDIFSKDQNELQDKLINFMEINKSYVPQIPMVTGSSVITK